MFLEPGGAILCIKHMIDLLSHFQAHLSKAVGFLSPQPNDTLVQGCKHLLNLGELRLVFLRSHPCDGEQELRSHRKMCHIKFPAVGRGSGFTVDAEPGTCFPGRTSGKSPVGNDQVSHAAQTAKKGVIPRCAVGTAMIFSQSSAQRGALKIGVALGICKQLARGQAGSACADGRLAGGLHLISCRHCKRRSHSYTSPSFLLKSSSCDIK